VDSAATGGDGKGKGKDGDGKGKGKDDDKKSKEDGGDKKGTSAKLDRIMKKLNEIQAMEKRLKALEKKAGLKSPDADEEQMSPEDKEENEEPVAVQPNVATLVIRVPADARVYLDGRRTRTANQAVRTFVTPKLADGSRYVYEVRAEIIRDGRVHSETRRVAFYAGSKVNVSFPALEKSSTTVAARSR
jgi:uncharacterized protein (TIGR03000 family)